MARSLLLLILDGFGLTDDGPNNAVTQAKTPHWDTLSENHPFAAIHSEGSYVGLPPGQMGNSEVGHMHIGAGRVIPQQLTRLNEAFADQTFFDLSTVTQAFAPNKVIHLICMVSPGGIHSHQDHLLAITEHEAYKQCHFYLHIITDGRDTSPKAAHDNLSALEKHWALQPNVTIASVVGRYYAMDRDKRWERTEQAYHLFTSGTAPYTADSLSSALEQAYERDETDEFISATRIHHEAWTIEQDHHVVLFNFRADRMRQITHALIDEVFSGFPRTNKPHPHVFSLTDYGSELQTQVLFSALTIPNVLGECVAKAGIPQVRIAESEKYAHVTYFLNGGREAPFALEERQLIPSPKVATYDLKPEMSAKEVTDAIIDALQSETPTFIVCNFANPDMVGHTGDLQAAIQAVETIDHCLGRILEALTETKSEMVLTADHGNVEKMYDEEKGAPHTAHTNFLVPFLYHGRDASVTPGEYSLSDIAPTILSLLKIEIPKEMTGKTILTLRGNGQ